LGPVGTGGAGHLGEHRDVADRQARELDDHVGERQPEHHQLALAAVAERGHEGVLVAVGTARQEAGWPLLPERGRQARAHVGRRLVAPHRHALDDDLAVAVDQLHDLEAQLELHAGPALGKAGAHHLRVDDARHERADALQARLGLLDQALQHGDAVLDRQRLARLVVVQAITIALPDQPAVDDHERDGDQRQSLPLEAEEALARRSRRHRGDGRDRSGGDSLVHTNGAAGAS
jgi:hypothetical protein